MSDCCGHKGHQQSRRPDFLLWGSLLACGMLYLLHAVWFRGSHAHSGLAAVAMSVFKLLNTMWWGLGLGILAVGVLNQVPREWVMSILGPHGTKRGIVRAIGAGLLLDLCNHGILLVAMKLYERGASLGQTYAFLIASPWNSFTLTLVLISLIGLPWTLAFIAGSAIIALLSGWLVENFVKQGVLPENPHAKDLPADFRLWPEIRAAWHGWSFSPSVLWTWLRDGLGGSAMIVKWLLFGTLLTALVQAFVPTEFLKTWYGPTLGGLGLTLLTTTLLEVCSEGSSPLAAELINRAHAAGNSFTFLMAGAATDYTEIMSLKETTGSWKSSLFLPLVTVPQVLFFGVLLNSLG